MNTKKEKVIKKLVDNVEIKKIFIDLNDLIREYVEEEFITLKVRKDVRNTVIDELKKKFW